MYGASKNNKLTTSGLKECNLKKNYCPSQVDDVFLRTNRRMILIKRVRVDEWGKMIKIICFAGKQVTLEGMKIAKNVAISEG